MNIDQLEALEAIIETGSFRKAGEKLNKAQSAISYAIKNLEEEFQCPLFIREGYKPELSPQGQIAYTKTKRVLEAMRDMQAATRNLSIQHEPELSVAVSALFPLQEITEVLKIFSREHPCTQLRINVEVLGALDRLIDREADIAITESLDSEQERFEMFHMMEIKMLAVAAKNHPLAKIKGALDSFELSKYPQIIIPSSTKQSKKKKAGVLEGALTWSVGDFANKKVFLLNGLGWGQMPEYMVREELANDRLVALKTSKYANFTLSFYLVKHRERILGPVAQRFWDDVKALFS